MPKRLAIHTQVIVNGVVLSQAQQMADSARILVSQLARHGAILPATRRQDKRKKQKRARDEKFHVFGRAALPRRPGIQGRAATLPYHDGEDACPTPSKSMV
jgi:hypothetical protein